MSDLFNNKVVIITGGAGGIGSSLSRELLASGAKVALLDLSFEEAKTTDNLLKIAVDITDAEGIREAIDKIIKQFTRIDMLVNNAGITHMRKFSDLSSELFDKVMTINFSASVNITRLCLPELIKSKGRIVAISSVAGFAPLYGRSAYSASKHAMQGFFGSLSSELKSDGVSVTIVSPSFIKSRPELIAKKSDQQLSPGATKKHTGGEQVSPEKAAQLILQAAAKRKSVLYLGKVARVAHWIFAVFPRLYLRLMTKGAKEEMRES